MTSTTSKLTRPRRSLRQLPTAALLTAAAVFAAITVFDLITHPADQGTLRTYKEYVLTASLLPSVFAVWWVLSSLHALHGSSSGRLGRAGLRIATIGLLALAVDSIVTIASRSTDTAGPIYPIAMLAALIGIVLIAVDWYRAGALPRWIGPTLAAGWFLGATPILGSDASFLILIAAFLAVAIGLRRHAPARRAAPVALDSSVTA